ncbi:MAG: SpoIID/LytB domain-containing protein, partial [Propionicimonas sp.]
MSRYRNAAPVHRGRVAALIAFTCLALLVVPIAPARAAVPRVPARFTITGSGQGHGAGMAQYGAYQLARTGSSTDDILRHYYPGTSLGVANNNPRAVKVQVLGPPADARTSGKLTVTGSRITITDGSGRSLGSFAAGTVSLKVKGTRVSARIRKKWVTASRLVFTWKNAAGTASVAGAQGRYRYGNLQVTAIGKRLNVVNQLAMNTEYLYGIDEMPASWGDAGGAAALRAQVIAARNYVITRILRLPEAQQGADAGAPRCDCHVFDDERSQNFTGWKKAGPLANRPWITAVDATIHPDPAQPDGSAVEVLRDPSRGLAETPYFASSGRGGGTGANGDVFGTEALSYLVHVDDPSSALAPGNPHLSWKRKLTQARAVRIFGLKKITSLAVTSTYPGGLVKSMTATAADGRTRTLTRTSTAWCDLLGVPAAWLVK